MLRKLLLCCMTLVIAVRGIECLATGAELCARVARCQQEVPLDDPRDGDPNESGCLCRGALVQVVSPVAVLKENLQSWTQLLVSDAALASFLVQPVDSCLDIS